MNKSVKIILLVVAIITALGGVLAFYKTIVSPPGHLNFKNQYIVSVNKDIAKIKSVKTDAILDSIYSTITHTIVFQTQNSKFTNNEADELLESFATQYVPIYVGSCKSKFNQSIWKEEVLKKIQAHIKELLGLQTSINTSLIGGDAKESLKDVNDVIILFYEAKRASYVDGYNGIQSAKQKISSARKYANITPINNCSDLVSNLNSVSSRLEQAHYKYLSNQVERLKYYYNYSQDEYDELALSISEKIDEYKKNAKNTYGYISDIAALENRAGEYYGRATFN